MPRLPLNRPAWSMVPITFNKNDFQVRDFPHTDAFVATTNIAGFTVHNILIDNGSSIDILFIKPFEQMNLDKRTLEPVGNSLFVFGGKKIDALGKKAIPISFAQGEKVHTETITFDIVNMDYPYTAIFGRGVLNKFKNGDKAKLLVHEDAITFRDNYSTHRSTYVQANRGKTDSRIQPHK